MEMHTWDDILSMHVAEHATDSSPPPYNTHATRAWPPVMIRDFLRPDETGVIVVDADTEIGDIVEFLAASPGAIAAVTVSRGRLLGIAVDDDVMALIKRDGMTVALEKSAREAIQRQRPVCSITDSPYVILQEMKEQGWDRIGVSEHGHIIGVIYRRDLVKFVDH